MTISLIRQDSNLLPETNSETVSGARFLVEKCLQTQSLVPVTTERKLSSERQFDESTV